MSPVCLTLFQAPYNIFKYLWLEYFVFKCINPTCRRNKVSKTFFKQWALGISEGEIIRKISMKIRALIICQTVHTSYGQNNTLNEGDPNAINKLYNILDLNTFYNWDITHELWGCWQKIWINFKSLQGL